MKCAVCDRYIRRDDDGVLQHVGIARLPGMPYLLDHDATEPVQIEAKEDEDD